MGTAKLHVILSVWNGDEKSWPLPSIRGIGVSALLHGGERVSELLWSFSPGDEPKIIWLADAPAPHLVEALLEVNEEVRRSRWLDPTILGPFLTFVGLLVGSAVTWATSNYHEKIAEAQSQDRQDLHILTVQAAQLQCNQGATDVNGVIRCLQSWADQRKQITDLQGKTTDLQKIITNQQVAITKKQEALDKMSVGGEMHPKVPK